MASSSITSWEIDGETVETVADFIFLGSKITADGDCSHEIKRCLLLGTLNSDAYIFPFLLCFSKCCLGLSLLFFQGARVFFNFMAAGTICSDFGAPQNKVPHCFHSASQAALTCVACKGDTSLTVQASCSSNDIA